MPHDSPESLVLKISAKLKWGHLKESAKCRWGRLNAGDVVEN